MRIKLSPGWRILKPSVVISSYEEEKIAIYNELLLKALLSGSDDMSDARCMLYKYAGMTNLSWIPGHHGVACNEEADDRCDKQAAAITRSRRNLVMFRG